MTTPVNSSTIRTINTRKQRGKKSKQDHTKLVDDTVVYLVRDLNENNPRPRLLKRDARRRLKRIAILGIRKHGKIRSNHVINTVADSVVKSAVDKGYISISECRDAKGKFTSEVTTRGKQWLAGLDTSNKSVEKAA